MRDQRRNAKEIPTVDGVLVLDDTGSTPLCVFRSEDGKFRYYEDRAGYVQHLARLAERTVVQ